MVLPGKRSLRETFDLYVNLNLPFADAYHAVLMKHLNRKEIVSFDRDFDRFQRATGDRIPGISRIEPS